MQPISLILEQGQTASNVVLSCVVSGWATELNKCNQVSWVDIGQDYSPAPVYTDNYKAELTITTSTVDQTFTCRCDRSVVDNIDVPVFLDFIGNNVSLIVKIRLLYRYERLILPIPQG